jgi:hypothetical protein
MYWLRTNISRHIVPQSWMRLTGRSLWRIFVNLHQHKLEWIRKADRDFAEDNQPIITGIRIELIPDERG